MLPAQQPTLPPIAPSIRDGDVWLGALQELLGGPSSQELPFAILHRKKTGSKWGGEANLLRDTILSAAVTSTICCWAGSLAGPDALANALLMQARANCQRVGELLRESFESHSEALNVYKWTWVD